MAMPALHTDALVSLRAAASYFLEDLLCRQSPHAVDLQRLIRADKLEVAQSV